MPVFQSAGSIRRVLLWLIAGSRGGQTRGRIIIALKGTPQNANRLSENLNMDYKTIRHHLEVLRKNSIITTVGEGYGITYFLSSDMEQNYALFEEIWGKIGK
jgi:DNA-binding transcriptional ArsR family regulator